MSAGAIPPVRPAAKAADPPQYAQFASFDMKKEESEDSLPAMPTWGDAESKKVVLEEGSVELQQLKKPETNSQNQPLPNGVSPSPIPGANAPPGPGRRSPYGPNGNQPAANGYMGPGRGPPRTAPGAGATANPYGARQGPGYNQMHQGYGYEEDEYSPPPTAPGYFDQGAYSEYGGNGNGPVRPGMNQPYGMGPGPQQTQQQRTGPPRGAIGAVAGAAMPDRSRSSPAPQQQQQEPGLIGGQFQAPPLTYSPSPVQGGFSPAPERSFSPAPQRNFSPAPQRTFSPAPQRTFSPAPQRTFSPAPQRQFSADSAPGPGRGPMPPRGPPRGTPYRQFSADSAPIPQRQFSGGSGGRPLVGGVAGQRPPPQRQYTADMARPPQSPGPQNNAGFDFQSGFSRPSRSNTLERVDDDQSGAAYPGYKPYKPGL
ncbi:hypothetical protein SLS53_002951 [Cytospora paraplurivora]|uniref:Uncharacterized protein n=1 Tax=Cytospora paraplurivora TaxID=2898453 RepID=A0AAN9UD42_9PEZI